MLDENDASLGVRGAADDISKLTLSDIERVWETYIVQNQPIEVYFKKGNHKKHNLKQTQRNT